MKLIVQNQKHEHAAREIITAYIPKLKIETVSMVPDVDDYAEIAYNSGTYFASMRINGVNMTNTINAQLSEKLCISKLLSPMLSKHTGVDLPWGILTGIRPAKMVREMHDSGMSYNDIYNVFCTEYDTHSDKAKLAIDVAKKETQLISAINPNAVSIYIGIPFCPTRCLYCSFTSQSIKFSNTLVEPYMDALSAEIDYLADHLRTTSTPIETIYIGGGTPTALSEANLQRLINKIDKSFDLSFVKEYTVEAGRPDTITKEKLITLKNAGVSRISINPQTMHQKTLDIIGRCHTPEDIINCYNMAVSLGFDHINTDLIAGLPGEDVEDFLYTLDKIKELNPSSVTVHTMSVKHGSYLDMNYGLYTPTATAKVDAMLTNADNILRGMGKSPYYLYRQKNMLGNLENVGYCNLGNECLYNVYIMEEVQSIFSLGAGSSTKVVRGDNIERVFNVKEVAEYIRRTDEMIERKKSLFRKEVQ